MEAVEGDADEKDVVGGRNEGGCKREMMALGTNAFFPSSAPREAG